jgi:hypothetical protein
MKKLFALLVVASLTAIGCDDKKSTGGKPDTTKTTPKMGDMPTKGPGVDTGKKADPPKADPPKADPPKADPPKADPPKVDPPKGPTIPDPKKDKDK